MTTSTKAGRPVVFGDGGRAYDFIYVGDTALADVCALKSDIALRVLQRRARRQDLVQELTELILESAGSKLPIRYEPAGQTFVTNRIGDPTMPLPVI